MSIHLGSGIKKERKWDIGKIVKEGFFMDSSFYVWKYYMKIKEWFYKDVRNS